MAKNIGVCITLRDKVSPTMKQIASRINMTTVEFNKASKAVGKLSKEINTKMKSIAKATAVCFSAVVAGGMARAQKTQEIGDRVDKLSQKIGMSRKAFQEWDYICSQSGMSVESLQMGMKTLVNQIDGVQKGNKASISTFRKLGVSVRDTRGNLKNQEQVFNECVIALTKMKNGTQKAKIANDLFGRSGAELAPIIQGNAQAIYELRKRAHELGLVLSDDVIDNCVVYGDLMDDLNKSSQMLGAGVMGSLLPSLIEVQKTLIKELPKIKTLVEDIIKPAVATIKFLAENIKTLTTVSVVAISVIAGFRILAGVGKLMMLYNDAVIACNGASKVFAVWQAIINKNADIQAVKFALLAGKMAIFATWQKVVTIAQWAWNTAMTANPIGLIIVGVGALIAGIVLLIKNWDKVTEAVSKAIEKLKMFCGIKTNKKVNVDVEETKIDGKKPPKHATGTSFFAGGYTSINEGGRGEIVNLPTGTQIIPHDIAKQSMNKQIKIDVNFNVNGNLVGNKELFEQFSDMLLTKMQNKLQTV